jgi:hypothetical protein
MEPLTKTIGIFLRCEPEILLTLSLKKNFTARTEDAMLSLTTKYVLFVRKV